MVAADVVGVAVVAVVASRQDATTAVAVDEVYDLFDNCFRFTPFVCQAAVDAVAVAVVAVAADAVVVEGWCCATRRRI